MPSGPTVARNFNPRPPRGGRRAVGAVPQSKEISIHAPREGGDAAGRSYIPHQAISIHAPREGGDLHLPSLTGGVSGISIHAPREGGDYSF